LVVVLLAVVGFGGGGCGGGTGSPAIISLSPSVLSMTYGQVVQLTVTVEDSKGNTITNPPTVNYTSNGSGASVSTTAVVCAGTWDSTTNPINCNLASPLVPGTATITAYIGNVNNPQASQTLNVCVHENVDSVVITSEPVGVTASSGVAGCVSSASQSASATFTAIPCGRNGSGVTTSPCPSGETDITNDVNLGVCPLTWTATPSVVATVCQPTAGTPCSSGSYNDTQITAAQPGQTQITANVANVTSSPVTFTACPVQSISLVDVNNGTSTGFSGAGATIGLTPTAIDTQGNTLSTVTFTYSSSQPAAVTAGSTLTSVDVGDSTIVASCTPTNSCNTGLYPVYSTTPYLTAVGGTALQTSIYAASTNSSFLVSISSNAAGNFTPDTVFTSPTTLPNNPNSMLVNSTGTTIVLGADPTAGNSLAMLVDISSAAITKLGFSGAVLAISPDGNTALFADTQNLRFYNIASASASKFAFPTAPTSAAFSPDSFRAFVVAPSLVGAWSSCTTCAPNLKAWQSSASIGATSVDFVSQGSFAYLAGGGQGSFNDAFNVYATCANISPSSVNPVGGITPGAGMPKLVRALPNGTAMLAVDSVNLYEINPGTFSACNTTMATNPSVSATIPLPSGFTPAQMLVTPDSSTVFLLGNNNSALYGYNFSSNTNTFTQITPIDSPTQIFFGGTTLDSSTLYVGANDTPTGASAPGAVHVIDVGSMTDLGTISTGSYLNGSVPNLVAVRPY
jgi:hypothetical protein